MQTSSVSSISISTPKKSETFLKRWKGHLWSIITYVPKKLFHLINKITSISKCIFNKPKLNIPVLRSCIEIATQTDSTLDVSENPIIKQFKAAATQTFEDNPELTPSLARKKLFDSLNLLNDQPFSIPMSPISKKNNPPHLSSQLFNSPFMSPSIKNLSTSSLKLFSSPTSSVMMSSSIQQVSFQQILETLLQLLDQNLSEDKLKNIKEVELYDENNHQLETTQLATLTGKFKIIWNIKRTEEYSVLLDQSSRHNSVYNSSFAPTDSQYVALSLDDLSSVSTSSQNTDPLSFNEEIELTEPDEPTNILEDLSNSQQSTYKSQVVDRSSAHNQLSHLTYTYQGTLNKGVLEGKGHFDITYSNFLSYVFLKGNFIEGSFSKGWIKLYSDDSPLISFIHKGNFLQSKLHGNGSISSLSHEGIRVLQEGIFENGNFIKGSLYPDSGCILTGTFDSITNIHQVRIINPSNPFFLYEGKLQDNIYQGEITLKTKVIKKVNQAIKKEKKLEFHSSNQFIEIIFKGICEDGKFINGEAEITWEDGKKRYATVEDSSIKMTTTQIPFNYPDEQLAGCRIEGVFSYYSLNGEGKIYNSENSLVYEGKIKQGYPHGKGIRFLADGTQLEGTFNYGEYQAVKTVTWQDQQ